LPVISHPPNTIMSRPIFFCISLYLVASIATTALVPTFVVISDDAALSNQTRATVNYAKSLAYQEFQVSAATFDTPSVQELRVSSVSSSAVSQVSTLASTIQSPCFFFIQVDQPAIATELSRLQVRHCFQRLTRSNHFLNSAFAFTAPIC
jgi:hypothetical protein